MQKSFRILRISSVRDYSHSSPSHPKCLFSQTEKTRIEQNPFGIFGSVRLEIILIAAHVIPALAGVEVGIYGQKASRAYSFSFQGINLVDIFVDKKNVRKTLMF